MGLGVIYTLVFFRESIPTIPNFIQFHKAHCGMVWADRGPTRQIWNVGRQNTAFLTINLSGFPAEINRMYRMSLFGFCLGTMETTGSFGG